MPIEKVTILDGSSASDENSKAILSILTHELKSTGAEVWTFALGECKLAHCNGCFGCWVETPGVCVEADDGGEIARAVAQSQTLVLFTPISFGGYSSGLKLMIDRLIPLALPYFIKYQGEVHHLPRYSHPPRLVAVGVQQRANPSEAALFKTLVGRNAINLHSSTHAAEVVMGTDSPEILQQRFASLLSRADSLPLGERMRSWMPVPEQPGAVWQPPGTRRALLIVGSPKTKSASTSGVLGSYLLERFRAQGWETESLTLRASLRQSKGQQELLAASEKADLLLLAFPLYVDSLPFLVTKALELIASHRQSLETRKTQQLVAVVNNGFPEAHQNALALAICHVFAVQSGITWAGGLVMGAGEALSGGESLTTRSPSHLSVNHVRAALDIAAAALGKGLPVPGEAVQRMARNPMPGLPFAAWRWLFMKMGRGYWHRRAAKFGVSKRDMLAQPFAKPVV